MLINHHPFNYIKNLKLFLYYDCIKKFGLIEPLVINNLYNIWSILSFYTSQLLKTNLLFHLSIIIQKHL